MFESNRKTMVVIGAGPKGLATAVKAKVLEEFGLPVDRVILIEKNKVAANWSGDFGYTNGEMKLGTSPEKDIVFPIETDVGDPILNQEIRHRLLQFTWTSFLVETNCYSDWVDRGRPAPCHLQWAGYLRWVSEKLEPQVKILVGEVTAIDLNPTGTRWELQLKNSHEKIEADRLMLTGPGQTRKDFLAEAKTQDLPSVFDLESFWEAIKNNHFPSYGPIAIVGAGENAASALLALSKYAPNLRVDIISPKGFISTRAENYYENQFYSQPERHHWSALEIKDRIDFIERTDLGVFSVHAMNLLNEQVRHAIIPGRVVGISHQEENVEVKIKQAQQISLRCYKTVILASGFDQVATLKSYLSERALEALKKALGGPLIQKDLMMKIQNDLSVEGMTPSLHLPMLAGLSQGPGFTNLSCLGKLSDRIFLRASSEQRKKVSHES